MKRVVSLILCFCILFSSVTSAQAIVLPRAIREIQAEAFMGDTSITGVLDLSGYENLDSIGDRAFKDTGITGINWGSNTVSRIGAGAFENTDITGIVMAGGEVGDRAFAGTDVFAADFYGGVYGDGVLRDSGATYAVFESDDVELAEGAFVNTETGEKDVLALVGPNGGTVEAYAAAKGIPYYSMESTRLVYDDQFVVEIDDTDYTARAILPLYPIVQGGTFPEAFSNGELEYPITEIGPHTFSGVEIVDGGTIVIPVGIQLPAEEERVNWPENIVVADIDLSNVQVQAQINGCAGKDYNDWYTGQYYEFHMDEGYTEDWIDFGYCFVDSDLTAAEQQVVASMIETTVIVDDRYDEDDKHDENVVRINADGRIVAVSEGAVDITYIVSLNGVELSRARATAHVLGMVPMNVPSAQLSIGEQIRLYPILNLSDLDPLSIHYYSEDDSVADVDPETGVVTAKRPGSTKIIAEAYCYIYQKNVGNHHRICTAECVITVVDGAFNADQTNLSLYGGESCDIAFINNNDKVITDVTWESSNAGAVFAKVHEDRTGATITTENGYAYPGHDRITFTATFEDGTTESVTVHVAGEVQVVYAEAEWPYYQLYTGDEPMEFQYFTYYGPGYSAENIHVYYDVEVLESNTEGAELVTVDDDGYIHVTDDASVTGVANVYATFVHADTGRTVARIKSGVIVNQGIPAIDAETAGFAFDQETFYIIRNDDTEGYLFSVRVADDDIWNYYWPKYEVISEDDGNPETEDDTGLVLKLYEDGWWEDMQPGTARIRATLVPHNPAELDPEAEPVTAEATVVIDDALPYLTYEIRWPGDDSGHVESGEFNPDELNYFSHGDINTAKLQGLPEGIGIERTEWHINEEYFSILGQDETSFSFSVIDWTKEDETLDIRVFLENGSEFFLSYPLRGCGLGDYNGIYLDPPAVTLSVGDVFTVEAYKEIWDQNNYEYHNDYNFYDPIWIDFYDQDVVVPEGGKLIDDRMPASVDEGGDEGEYEYIGLYETRQLRAVKPGETVVTVYGLFTETDGNGGEQMYQDQMDLYVNVVEPEMTLEEFDPVSVMFVGSEYDPSVAISYTGLHPDMTFSFSEEGILEMDYDAWKLIPVGEGTVDVTVTATKGDLEPQSLTATVTVYGTDMFFVEGNRLSMPAGEGSRILHIENNTGKEIDHVEWISSDENVVMFYNPNGNSGAYIETDDGVVDVDTMTDEIGARAEISALVYFTDGTMKEIIATATVREMAFFHNDSVELVPNESFSLSWEFDGWTPDYMDFAVNYTDIVSVSAQGVITALAPGYAEVCLYAADDSTWVATYVPVEVRNFAANLVPDELNLSMGEAAYVVPTINVEEGYWINDQQTRFWSMDESVATVDHLGLVTAVAPGSTTIGYEAYTFNDGYRLLAYATVNVTAEESGVLAISDRYVELHARERYQLGVTVSDNYIEEKAIESIEWVSSDEGWLSVDDTGLLYAFNWDIEEPRTVFVTANVTFTDGTTDSMICSVKLLPALISVNNCPNFYEIGVEESVPFEYAISMNQAAWDIDYDVLFSVEDVSEADKPEDERATIVTVDEDGIMTGVAPGVALVRMNVMEILPDGEYGRNLFTGGSYVYVDTPIPEPTEGSIAFEFDHYYLSLEHHGGNHAHIVDENGLGQFHNMVFTSDNERVVTINNGGWMEPSGNGTTTIHAWFEGYEQYAISARVTVGTPELTFGDAELDENGNPVVTVGDVLTVKIENMPPFGNMREDQITPNHINLNVDDSMLREMGRSDEENTFTFLAVGEGWTEGGIEVNVNNDRNFDMGFGVSIHGGEAEFTMDERALVMAEGEIVQLWPHSDWEEDWAELISFSSDNTEVLTVTAGTRCLLLKGEAQGTATVTAEYRMNDDSVITTTTVVGVGEYDWNVSFDNIPSVLYVGDWYDPWPIVEHSTYYEPEHGNWHISDESVAGIEEHDDDVWLVARQPGEFTLSMTFSMDNPGFDFAEQTTVMKTITVVERPYNHIEFEHAEVDAPLHNSFFVPLHINTDWELLSVEYWSEDEGLVSVRNMLDDSSYPEEFPDYEHGEAVIITAVADNNSTRVFAKADFRLPDDTPDDDTDNETYTAYATLRVHPHDWLDIHVNDVELTSEDWGEFGRETVAWLDYNTYYDLSKNSEYTLMIQWHNEGGYDVADFVRDENGIPIHEGHDVIANGVVIEARNPGTADMRVYAAIVRALRDEHGNIVLDDEGNVVYNTEDKVIEGEYEFCVKVYQPRLDVWFDNPNADWDENGTPVYELRGTDNRYHTNWHTHAERVGGPLTERVWVDDASVATVSATGELISVAPGETRVRVRVETANGYGVENEAIVRVFGNEGDTGRVDMGFYTDNLTIAEGESANIAYYLHDNGYTIHNEWWSSSDTGVATVSKDGTVYGVEKGFAVIIYHVDTDYGWHEAQCIVEVTGEHGGAWFAEDVLTLWRGSEATVGLHADSGDPINAVLSLTTSNEDVLMAEVVKDENGGYILNEEGQPVIRLTATDWDLAKTYYITVTAVVEDFNGEDQTATMLVIVPEQRLRIAGYQFGEGRWEHIELFDWDNPDWNNVICICEQYLTSDPGMNVKVEVTVDKMHVDNGDGTGTEKTILVWDPECEGYIGVAEGETTMHYIVTADSGESYTADLKVFVGGEDRMPDELKIREGYEVIVTALGDNNSWVHDAIDWPEYKGCELAYEIIDQQLFGEGEGNVISLGDENEDSRIYTENAGIATVRIYCPHEESLNTQVQVLVFDPNDTLLTRVDECEDPSVVKTGETVQLGFRNAQGGAVAWDELNISVETFSGRDSDDIWQTSEDGMSFTCYFWDGEFGMEVKVRFPNGYEWLTDYRFTMDKEGFFRVRLNNNQADEEFVANPGDSSEGGLGWDSSIQEDFHVFWQSADESIATVNEYGDIVLSADVTFTEENPSYTTEIIGTAMRWVGEGERDFSSFDGWETIASDSFPVRIIPAAKPNFEINTDGVYTVVVGDKLNMWISEFDEKTNAPYHEFISGDESVLAPTGGYGEFIALQPGTVTVTAKAWNGNTEEDKAATMAYDRITVYVVAAEPTVWFDTGIDLRAGESYYAPVYFEANGSEKAIANVTYSLENDIADVTFVEEEWAFILENARILTGTDENGNEYEIRDAAFTVTVTLSDGKTFTFSPNVHIRKDDEVGVWAWHDENGMHLSADGVIGANPTVSTVWQWFDTDAALTNHEHAGTDTAWVEWEIVGQYDADGNETDAQIVTLGEGTGTWNDGMTVHANGMIGSALLHTTIIIRNAAGDEMARCEDFIPVYVDGSYFNVWFDQEQYDLFTNVEEDYKLIGWNTQEDNVTGSRREIFWSDDPTVVATDVHGNLQIVAPGETDVHVQIIFGEGEHARTYQADTHVVVYDDQGATQRVDVSLDQSQLTIGVDESAKLYPTVHDNGVQIHNQYWFNKNPAVVEVNNDGTVYGVAPGVAMIKYCVETEYGQEEVVCIVEVTGEAAAFRLGSYAVTLHTEQSEDVEIINETGLELSNVQVHVSDGDPVNAELVEGEDGKLYVRIHATDWGSSITKYETVTVTADTENGPVSANCQVIIPIQKLRITGHPFEENGWYAMGSGERMMVETKWVVSDPNLVEKVREEFTTDSAEVAYYDEATGEVVAVASGETVIRYTVYVEHDDGSRGETHTRTLTIFVDQDRTPETVVALHDPQIVFLDWGGAHLELDYQPEMTHTHTKFVSHNPEVLTFDNENDSYFTMHGEGMAHVEVTFPENDHLNFDAYVLVIDQNNVQLRRVNVAEGEDPERIYPEQTVELLFTNANGDAVIWDVYGVPVTFEPVNHDTEYVEAWVNEDNAILMKPFYTHTDSSIAQDVRAHFYDDLWLQRTYTYWMMEGSAPENGEPDVWMDDIAVRPGQTYTMNVGFNGKDTGIEVASVSAQLAEAIADVAITENNEIVFTNARTIPVEGEEFVIQDAVLTTTITLTDGSEHVRESNVHITMDEEIKVEPFHDDVFLSIEPWGEDPTESVVWQQWHHNAAHYDEENPGTDKAWITWELVNPVDEETGETIVVAELDGWFTDEERFLEENAYRAPWNNGPMVKAVSEGEAILKTTLTLYNEAGDQIAYGEDEIHVYVTAPHFDVGFNHETYEMNVGEKRRLDAWTDSNYAGGVDSVTYVSSNPAVATVDVTGHAVAHAPGETIVTMTMEINGQPFTAQTKVVVSGVQVALEQSEITIGRGESMQLNLIIDENEYPVYSVWFETLDHGVATVNNDGYVYGVETGSTVVYCYVDHDFGMLELPCVVHVEGDEDVLALNTHYVELSSEGQQEISFSYTGEGTPVSVEWSTGEEYVFAAPIRSNGQMTDRAMILSMGAETESDHYETVYCFVTVEMTAEDGSTYTEEFMDACLVKVNKAGIRIANYQFGPGQWGGFNMHDEEEIWEQYIVTDPTFCRIEVCVTTDDPSIAVYDEGAGVIRSVGQGDTWAYYTVNGYKLDGEGNEYLAESVTDRRLIRVEMDCMPESVYARYNPLVVPLEDGEGYLEMISEPEYTGVYMTFYSQNPEIIDFENPDDARFTIHGTGLATVDVICPNEPQYNTTAQVLVMDMNVLRLARVDTEEGEDPYIVHPYETVQLGFWQEYTDEDGNVTSVEAPLWEQYGIPVRFEARRNYDPNRLIVTDDLKLTTTWTDFDEEIHHWVRVIFGEGESEQTFDVCYPFHIAQDETYFYAVAEDDRAAYELVINPGDYVNIGYESNIEWQDNYVFECYIGWDENGNQYDCLDVYNGNQLYARYAGEGVVYARIMEEVPDENGDGAFYYTIAEDSIPVRVIEPEVPEISINPENGHVVRMGEILQVYLSHENENTFAPNHSFASMDESILEPVYDENGDHVYGQFRAVGLGSAQIIADAYYGYEWQGCSASVSEWFHVIPGNASIGFEQDYVELRPGQTMTLPIYFNANGSEDELSGYTVSVTDENILSAELTELEDGTAAVRVTRLAVSGDAQVNVQAQMMDGSTRGASCTIGVASEVYLNLTEQTIFLYTDEADGPTEADVYLTWETNAAFATDEENPGTDTLWIDWSTAASRVAVSDDIGADTATNNGIHVKAVAQGLTSVTGYVTVKDVYGTVIAEGEVKVSIYVCSDRVNVTLVDAPGATEYVGNVGDAAQISWTTDEWSREEGLPEGYSVLYKAVDQYGNETDVITVDEDGWFYPQTCGEANIQVRVRESYVNETSGNTNYRIVAAGMFPVRVIEPETPNITVTADRDALTVGELVQFSISYDNSNTFAPWYYIEVDETILDPVYNEEDDEILGLYKVFDTNEDAQTTVTVYANYGTSAENAQSEVSITLPIQAGMPVIEMPMMNGDMRPGQVIETPVYFNDNASGIGMESWSAESSDTEIVTVERTELDGEDALRVSCLSDARDAVVTVTVVLDNGETVTFDYDVCPVSNSEVWVEADDRYIRMNDAAFGEEGHERWLYVGFGTNAAVAGDPNRDGTDYAKITDWHVVNPDGVTVVSIGEPEGEDGNSVYVRAENVGTAYVYATVELYDAADNFLAKDTAEFEIEVSEATMNVWFDSGAYGFSVGQRNHINVNRSTYAPADQVIYESSDESVFTVDIWGNLMMQGPGTATYTVTYIYGDKSFSASTQIEVYGPKVQMHANELTLAVGESATIPHTVEENGYSIHVLSWTSSDENVASITPDGKVYAVAPGVAMVTLYAGFDWGDVEYVCTVTVTGEEEAGLALSERAMTLYRTNSAQLEVEYTGEGTLDESSISWYSSDSDVVSVDNGVLYAPWRDNAMDSDTVFILCQAQVNMGTEEEPVWEMVTDECYVHVPAPSVYSNNMTFGEGMWYNLEIGDMLYNEEGYFVNDSSIVVETSIRVDNTDVAVYDAENGWFRAVGAGVTTAYYTMTVYRTDENGELQPTGETYTVTADLVVEQNTEPSEVRCLYAPYVVDLSWQWEYLPLEFVPQEGEQYADCYVEFESLNPEVLTFSYPYSSEMTLHSEGLATVQITCPDYPHLNTTAQVLVFDSNTLQLVAADESNPYSVRPYQETQLSFRTVSWDDDYNTIYMPPVWEREGVEVTYYPYNEDEARNITDDLKLTVFYTGGNVYQSVEVEFNGGQRLHLGSYLTVNGWDPYFIARYNGQTEAVGVIGMSGWVDSLHNFWQHYGEYTFSYESSDTSVVTVDENGMMQFLSYGDAVITMTATINGGEITMESTLPVYVRNPETPDCWIDVSTHAVKLGEIVELSIGYENGFASAPDHSYTSLNPEILEQAYDEYGNEMFGCFRAVGIGEAVIQLDASYGTGEDRLSATAQDTFYVIPGDPQLQFDTEATGLRVGQTLVLPVEFRDNGSGATLAEDPEYSFWVDYGESVTVTDTILEDGRYAVLVTANDPYNSPLINVKAKLSDGSEVYGSKWLSFITDDFIYLNINHDGASSAELSNKAYGFHPMSAQFRVAVDTNADIGGLDTLEITWRADDDSFIEWDYTETDEYGNGIIVRGNGGGYTNVYADVKLTLASGEIRTNCISFWVSSYDAYCSIQFSQDSYDMVVGDGYYLDVNVQTNCTQSTVTQKIYVDNESVAYVSNGKYIYAAAPGTANLICRVVFSNGEYVEHSVPVTVQGASITWADGSEPVIISMDSDPIRLQTAVEWQPEDVGYANGGYWDSSNYSVVSIDSETGDITPVAPGTAVVSFTQYIMYDGGYESNMTAYRTIVVQDNGAPFSLSETDITLAGESTRQLTVNVLDDSHGEVTGINWSAGNYVNVDESGLVSVNVYYDSHVVLYTEVSATVTFEDGYQYTAYCHVTVNPRQINLYGWQFSSGNWVGMDYNSVYRYHDMYELFDNRVNVEMTFESSNTEIATVDEYGNIYSHNVAGDADITMTMKGYVDGVYTGESYVRKFRVRVDMDTTPSWMEYGDNKTWVIPLNWDTYYLPHSVEPYTSWSVEMTSDNPSVAYFNYPYEQAIQLAGAGEANLTMTIQGTELTDTAKIIVIDPDQLSIAAEDGRTVFGEGEAVQLVVNGLGAAESEVSAIYWYESDYNDSYGVDSDGILMTESDYGDNGQSSVWADVIFNCGTSIAVPSFHFDIVL